MLEFVPETVYRISKHYAKNGQRMPPLYVKLYVYQMCRALGYIHSLGVCHRDIKPQACCVPSSGLKHLVAMTLLSAWGGGSGPDQHFLARAALHIAKSAAAVAAALSADRLVSSSFCSGSTQSSSVSRRICL